ncbi:MAG: hypothetical protein NTX48_18540 [Planctomycetales bacterium]|nr:hypothetical protein [Planctomycetales bacterium]
MDGALEENLSETIAALSGVDESDFCKYTTMELPFESDLFQMRASTRANDEELLNHIIEHADRRLDGMRLDYCRLDKPQMCSGILGYIPGKNKFAVFVFDPASDDGRMIAREPEVPVAMPGIGLDLESIQPSSVDTLITDGFATDALGGRLKRLLRTYATALSATSDESKILTIVFALDGILTPEGLKDAKKFRKFIGVSASMHSADFQRQYDRFCEFYATVRNPLVHDGKSYPDLCRDRKSDLLYLQSLVAGLLASMLRDAHEAFGAHWARKMAMAKTSLS